MTLRPKARRIVIAVLIGASAVISAVYAGATILGTSGFDWAIFVEAGRRVYGGDLYASGATYAYRWSPVFAYVMGPLSLIGVWGWTALHLASLVLLPRRLALLALVAWPLWFDIWVGNAMTFVFVFAALGLAGNRWGMLAFLALTLIAPRPLMLPLAAWFLWREPSVRLPFVAIFVVHAAAVAVSGWGPEWIARLLDSGSEMTAGANLGPSRWIGVAWIPIGLALGAWAFWRGRPALAGLLVQPYWWPIYLLLPLAELAPRSPAPTSLRSGSPATPETSPA